jgi:FAD/FMN-containing dehydrogenase
MTAIEKLDSIDWPALRRGMAGELILAGDERMVLANKHFAARLPFEPPRALMRCADADDVRRALVFVEEQGAPFAVRSGGHCFGDLSASPGLVVDLAQMNRIEVEDGRVRCGPGALSGDLSRALAGHGRVIPTGGCPLVGIGGLALAGGFGFLGRRHGLTTDQVMRMEVVLADGRLAVVSAAEEPDLFWALRGGGAAGFGIVTGLSLRTHPLEPLTLCNGRWPIAEAAALIDEWQHWAPDEARAVNLELGLFATEFLEDPPFVELFGIVLGSPGEAAPHIAELESRLGRLAAGLATWQLEPAAGADFVVGLLDRQAKPAWLPSLPYAAAGFQSTRSHFFDRPIGREAIEECVRHFAADRRYAQQRELELVPWGGAYGEDDTSACFAHRRARLLIRHSAFAGARSGPDLRAHAAAWSDSSAATLAAASAGGAYQGYAEPGRDDWESACYQDGEGRLAELRGRFDPAGLFSRSRRRRGDRRYPGSSTRA